MTQPDGPRGTGEPREAGGRRTYSGKVTAIIVVAVVVVFVGLNLLLTH